MYTSLFVLFVLATATLVSLVIAGILMVVVRDSIVVGVPFVSTRRRAHAEVVKLLRLHAGDVIYDLGCGNGDLLLMATRLVPGSIGVGVERGIFPYLLARWKTRGSMVQVKYADIATVDLRGATHIYCYLSPFVMEKLAVKFLNECNPDTRIVACDFALPNWMPTETVSIAHASDPLSRTLYCYNTPQKILTN